MIDFEVFKFIAIVIFSFLLGYTVGVLLTARLIYKKLNEHKKDDNRHKNKIKLDINFDDVKLK